jgi:hypothetical protein
MLADRSAGTRNTEVNLAHRKDTVFKSGKGLSLSGFGGFYLDRRRESTAFKFNPGQKLRALFGWSSKYKGKL